MQVFQVEGGRRISGQMSVQGAKNSALPLLAASVLCPGESCFFHMPCLSDVYSACRILTHLGCRCRMEDHTVAVDTSMMERSEIPDHFMREMRSSIIFLGAMLGRLGEGTLSFPGGCELGPRPIDLHLSALRKMGVTITEEYGVLKCRADKGIHGAKLLLPFPSVGATENILLAACLAKGCTELKNAAREPEIVDLAGYLNQCGAKIHGAGEGTILVEGSDHLTPSTWTVMPDRIAAATFLSAAAATGGEILLNQAVPEHLESILPFFEEMGCGIHLCGESIYLNAPKRLKPVKTVRTMPYPAFPTDAQALLMAPLCKARGTSVIVETIFESRFKHVDELVKMGAEIKVEGQAAIIDGRERLYGSNVRATDLRGGAALVVAGLSAEGTTAVGNIHHIDRGYEALEDALSAVGGKVSRLTV